VRGTARRARVASAACAVGCLAVSLVIAPPIAPPAGAALPDLVPTYGTGGVSPILATVIRGVAALPDGRAIVVGRQDHGSGFHWTVHRLTASGQLDTTFGDGIGVVRPFPLSSGVNEALAVTVQPDGRIVVAGDHNGEAAVVRLTAEGRLDESFSGDGRAVAWSRGKARAVAVQPDGGVVVAGDTDIGTSGTSAPRWAVGRFLANGAPDPVFDGDGWTLGDYAAGSRSHGAGMALQPDGRIVVAGNVGSFGAFDVGFARLTSTGAPDGSFDSDGRVVVDPVLPASTTDVTVLGDGRVVAVAGMASGPVEEVFTGLVALTPGGAPDPGFGANGVAVRDLAPGTFDRPAALAVHPGDRVLVVGSAGTASSDAVVGRFTSAGQLDPTFSGDGVLLVDGGTDSDGGRDVAPGVDGSLFVVINGANASRVAHVSSFLPGYWMVSANGEVYPFGGAPDLGDGIAASAGTGVVKIEPTPSGAGYYVLDALGRVHTFGDAVDRGHVDRSVLQPDEAVASISVTPTNGGYWVFTSRGRVLTFGNAPFLGDVTHLPLNGPVLGSIPTPSGVGYYMVASDGGIFAFGDAAFRGSMGGIPLNQPVQGLVPTADNGGYWLVAGDGGIFAFGNADFRGSMGATPLNQPVVGMVRYGNGYLMVASDGGIFSFSDLPFVGSLGANPPASPVVGVASFG
jgi:uncharacterized delta-60 repeat protein